MKYLLDTNICIYIIKKYPESVMNKFKEIEPGDVGISSITYAELMFGVQKSQFPRKNQTALEEFVLLLDIMPFDEDAAIHYGHIRDYLHRKGALIGPLDLLIAGHAQSLGSILVTNNGKEFSRIPKLKVENWV